MTAPVSTATSFEAFYRAERLRMLRYFGRRAGGDAAPDLVQEVFARLLRSGAFDRVERPQAYLTRIAQNLIIDGGRRKHRDPVIFSLFDEERNASSRPEQTWRIEAMDLFRLYRQTVRAMPPKTRRVFVMHRMRHLTYKEIAERLGVCFQTVEYHMMRALTLCRAAVAAQW